MDLGCAPRCSPEVVTRKSMGQAHGPATSLSQKHWFWSWRTNWGGIGRGHKGCLALDDGLTHDVCLRACGLLAAGFLGARARKWHQKGSARKQDLAHERKLGVWCEDHGPRQAEHKEEKGLSHHITKSRSTQTRLSRVRCTVEGYVNRAHVRRRTEYWRALVPLANNREHEWPHAKANENDATTQPG